MKQIFTLLSLAIFCGFQLRAGGPGQGRIGFTGNVNQGETFHIILENQQLVASGLQMQAPDWAVLGVPFVGEDGSVWVPVTPTRSIPRLENTNQRWLTIVGIDNITGVRTDRGPNVKLQRQQVVGGPDGGNETTGDSGSQAEQSNAQNGQPYGIDATKGGQNTGSVDIRPFSGAGEIGIVTVGEILMREVEVFDQSGKKIMAVRSVEDGNRIQVDFSQQRPGLYILVVYMDNHSRVVRKIQWK